MNELRQRRPRKTNDAFLAYVRRQRCCACDAVPPAQAAHIRAGSPEHDKRPTGAGEKPDDRWCVPLCALCHLDGPEALHRIGEERFFRRAGFDPFAIAAALYAAFLATGKGLQADKASRRPKKRSGVKRSFTFAADKSRPKMKSAPLTSCARGAGCFCRADPQRWKRRKVACGNWRTAKIGGRR